MRMLINYYINMINEFEVSIHNHEKKKIKISLILYRENILIKLI